MFCSTAFLPLGRAQAAALGYKNLPIVTLPHPFGSRSRQELKAIAQASGKRINELATASPVEDGSADVASAKAPSLSAAVITVEDDIDAVNRLARERRWSDGLPVVPPTQARVERMLRAVSLPAQQVIAKLAPGFGAATVERIAVNAVMAGCEPAAMPVLIAAVEAVADPAFNLQALQATTNSAAVWLIVTGPIAQQLGINAETNCLGQGTWANATLGRALRLVMQNIGGAIPGEVDRATQGQPGKYSFCCGENNAANAWAPLAVDYGYAADDSCVTVVGAAGTLNMNTHAKDVDDIIRVFADTLAHPTSNDYFFGGEPWIVLAPEHAQVLQEAGLSKAEVRQRLWEASKMQAARHATKDFVRTQSVRRAELGTLTPDTLLPISPRPEGIHIIVAGGAGTHSVYVPTFGNTRSVTRKVGG